MHSRKTITIDEELLEKLNKKVEDKEYNNLSQAIEHYIVVGLRGE